MNEQQQYYTSLLDVMWTCSKRRVHIWIHVS